MRLRELARLLQAHPRASAHTVGLGRRLLREAKDADAEEMVLPDDAAMSDPTGATDADLNRAAGEGFKQIVAALIGTVFDGSAAWADVRERLDTVFESLDAILERTPVTSSFTESYTDPALRRRGRLLAESILDREPVKLHLAGGPGGGARDTANGSRAHVPTGRDFGRSILNGD